jgi:1-acyl-sn-glycerol-3-phosphate acyltransferase
MNPPEAWIQEARPGPLYRVCRIVVSSIARGFLDWKVYHPERVPVVGPVILASNHQSFADPPLIAAGLPRTTKFLARETLFKVPALGSVIRFMGAYPIDRDGGGASGLRTVLSLLDSGAAVLLFPEGTRSPNGEVQAARSGIGLVVIRSTAPVVPVRLFGLNHAWGRHHRFPRPHPIVIKYGQPLDFEDLRREAATASKQRTKAIYEEVSRQVMKAITDLQPHEDVRTFAQP